MYRWYQAPIILVSGTQGSGLPLGAMLYMQIGQQRGRKRDCGLHVHS
jgi:hypothetical protein